MLHKLFIFSFLILGIASCSDDPVQQSTTDEELVELLISKGNGSLDFYSLPSSDDLQKIPQDPKNPLTKAKVELGKLLFHEPGLAVKSKFDETMLTYSCASCHHAKAGFQANVPQGIGDGGMGFGSRGEGRIFNTSLDVSQMDVQPIRTPSVLNVAFQSNLLWNGQFGATGINNNTSNLWTIGTPLEVNRLGFEGTETQAIAGLSVHRFGLSLSMDLIESTSYKEMFNEAFSDKPVNDRFSIETAGLAIAAYERTLLSNQSPFQLWIDGNNDAMTNEQKQGAILFFSNNCGDCHTGPALNSMDFYAYGLNDLSNGTYSANVDEEDLAHLGRGGFTKIDEDNYKFKVPQLYNLKDSPFYGHGSSFTSVKEIVQYKNIGIAENPKVPSSQLAEQFQALELADYEIDLIVDFIENGLYDPNLGRYVPDEVPSGLCFPNNDMPSRMDIGCN